MAAGRGSGFDKNKNPSQRLADRTMMPTSTFTSVPSPFHPPFFLHSWIIAVWFHMCFDKDVKWAEKPWSEYDSQVGCVFPNVHLSDIPFRYEIISLTYSLFLCQVWQLRCQRQFTLILVRFYLLTENWAMLLFHGSGDRLLQGAFLELQAWKKLLAYKIHIVPR